MCEVIARLIRFIVAIISQCIYMSKHHIAHLKYVQFLFVIYITVKLRKIILITKINLKRYVNTFVCFLHHMKKLEYN